MAGARVRVKRKKMNPVQILTKGLKKTCGSLFLDSGAHSLYNEKILYLNHANGYDWYDGPEFKVYLDTYAAFLKAHPEIDFYVNVDVIFDPERTWRSQEYLEKEHGLNPVPVIHYGAPLKWIEKHLDAGYTYLGIGGLGQEAPKAAYVPWADKVFDYLCPPPHRVPVVKTHGFAMTSFELMTRYPWWSVDSASWAKAGGFGTIYVPPRRNGEFLFGSTPATRPRLVATGHRSKAREKKGAHYLTLSPAARADLYAWLDEIGVPIGTMVPDPTGKVEEEVRGRKRLFDPPPNPELVSDEYGVSSQYNARGLANLRYFDRFCKALPPWPRTFAAPARRAGLGLKPPEDITPIDPRRVPGYPPSSGLKLYFSGGSALCETGLDHPDIMPSYWMTVYKHKDHKPDSRIRGILAARRESKARGTHP